MSINYRRIISQAKRDVAPITDHFDVLEAAFEIVQEDSEYQAMDEDDKTEVHEILNEDIGVDPNVNSMSTSALSTVVSKAKTALGSDSLGDALYDKALELLPDDSSKDVNTRLATRHALFKLTSKRSLRNASSELIQALRSQGVSAQARGGGVSFPGGSALAEIEDGKFIDIEVRIDTTSTTQGSLDHFTSFDAAASFIAQNTGGSAFSAKSKLSLSSLDDAVDAAVDARVRDADGLFSTTENDTSTLAKLSLSSFSRSELQQFINLAWMGVDEPNPSPSDIYHAALEELEGNPKWEALHDNYQENEREILRIHDDLDQLSK